MIERVRQLASAVSFHRGLALGALVGAAIAGSTIWSRLRLPRQWRLGRPTTDGVGSAAGEAPGPGAADRHDAPRR